MIAKTVQIGVLFVLLAHSVAPAEETDPINTKPISGVDTKKFDLDAVKSDPSVFFEQLVQRYHEISSYRDASHLVQITRRAGEQELREETDLICIIEDGELSIRTPSRQLREGFGLNVPFRRSEPMKQMERRYQFWLAPHMALRFADEPLQQLREGIEDGFTPVKAERVMIDERSMFHLALSSGDGLSEAAEATFDFYINPDSLLIERINGLRHMPDGSDFITTLEIEPAQDVVRTGPALTG